MAVSIAEESPLQDDVRALIAALNDYLLPLSPIEYQFKMTAEEMAGQDTTVFVARNDEGRAVGVGALKRHPDALGEVKRMFTLTEVRGQRAGAALVQAIEARARAMGLKRLVLETGTGDGMKPAWRLYERAGFTRCGAVLDYPDSEWSVFYEKSLAPAPTAA